MSEHSDLRFFVDESLMGLGKGLAIIRRGEVVHPGHPQIPEVQPGALDKEWMSPVARMNLTAIGKDSKIRFKEEERKLWRSVSLRMIRLGGSKNLTTWGYLCLLVVHWEKIEDYIKNRPEGPWFIRILPSEGLREVDVPD